LARVSAEKAVEPCEAARACTHTSTSRSVSSGWSNVRFAPKKRTFVGAGGMSEKCQKQTSLSARKDIHCPSMAKPQALKSKEVARECLSTLLRNRRERAY
jgi:hypothetical protein